jgi:hypothetical protein
MRSLQFVRIGAVALAALWLGCGPVEPEAQPREGGEVEASGFLCTTDAALADPQSPPPDDQARFSAEEKRGLKRPPLASRKEEPPAPDEDLLWRQAEYLKGLDALEKQHVGDPAALEAARSALKQSIFEAN